MKNEQARVTRLVVRLPVRSDGGWILEGRPGNPWFPTNADALSDPWRFEFHARLEGEIERLKTKGDRDAP